MKKVVVLIVALFAIASLASCDKPAQEAAHSEAVKQSVFEDVATGEFFRCVNCDAAVFSGDTLLFQFKLAERLGSELPARKAVGQWNKRQTNRVIGIRVIPRGHKAVADASK